MQSISPITASSRLNLLQGQSTAPFDKTNTAIAGPLITNTSANGPLIIRLQPVVDRGVSGSVLATTKNEMQRQQEVTLSLSIFASSI